MGVGVGIDSALYCGRLLFLFFNKVGLNMSSKSNSSVLNASIFQLFVAAVVYLWYIEDNDIARYAFFGYLFVLTTVYVVFALVFSFFRFQLEKSIISSFKSDDKTDKTTLSSAAEPASIYVVFIFNTIWAVLLVDKGYILAALTFYLTYIFCAIKMSMLRQLASTDTLANKEKS